MNSDGCGATMLIEEGLVCSCGTTFRGKKQLCGACDNRARSAKWHRIHTPGEQELFYLSVLPSIRAAARVLGYGVGVHGSMRRDLDLIAVPWVDTHAPPDTLAKAIQYAACGMHADSVTWEQKPCGRIATSLPICLTDDRRPNAGHIDLSVMPGAKESM